MEKYIKDFLNVIRNCSVDNTYKMAWARALVEIATKQPKQKTIKLEEIAIKMFEYYWNQTIYLMPNDLVQGSNLSNPPAFIKKVKDQIEIYYKSKGEKKPIHYRDLGVIIETKLLKRLVSILKENVSYRFLNLNNKTEKLYAYNKGDDSLLLAKTELIKEYSDVLFEAINYRWTQILEDFNASTPRIAKKVRVLELPKIERKSLERYREYLSIENPKPHKCFLCTKPIIDETPSIDHLIPWSFVFKDSLWNLVYAHKGCNSSKSNILISDKKIIELKKRNKRMINLLKAKNNIKHKKIIEELIFETNRDTAKDCYIHCKYE